MSRINLAIVGCGWVADWHVRDGVAHLPDLFELRACCDLDPAKREEFGERHGVLRRVATFEEVLVMPNIDAVILCTPPGLHFSMVMDALAAGKHVICEKPFTSSLELVDKVAEAARTSAGQVMPIFQYRFGDSLARVRHVIQSGLAGKAFLSSVETAKRRGADYYAVPWRGKFATELGGVLLTQAIHIHDVFMWLMGPAAKVSCFKTTRVNPVEVEDCAVASLVMADGSLAALAATLGSARQVTRIRLCFEHVTFECEAYDEASMKPGEAEWSVIPMNPEIGAAIAAKMAEVPPAPPWFAGQYQLFHQAIHAGGPLPVTLEDARRSLELITAMFHANETGVAVSLPIGQDHPMYRGWVPAKA